MPVSRIRLSELAAELDLAHELRHDDPLLVDGAAAKVIQTSQPKDFIAADQRDSTSPVAKSKIFLFLSDPNQRLIPRHPVPNEGRFAIVTDVGRGAVDADALLTNSA